MPPSSGRVFRLAQRQLMLMQLLISMSSSCLAAYSCQLPPSQMPLCALPLVGPATCLPGGDYTRTYFYTFRFLPFGIFITVSFLLLSLSLYLLLLLFLVFFTFLASDILPHTFSTIFQLIYQLLFLCKLYTYMRGWANEFAERMQCYLGDITVKTNIHSWGL